MFINRVSYTPEVEEPKVQKPLLAGCQESYAYDYLLDHKLSLGVA